MADQPLTGDVKTPSGATVNTDTGALVTPPPASTSTGGTSTTSTGGVSSSSALRSLVDSTGTKPTDGQSFSEFAQAVMPGGGATPPPPPSYTDIYAKMRADAGVPALEDNLSNIQQEKAAIQGSLLQFKASEEGAGGETMAGYTGRMSEAQRNAQAQLDSLNLEEAAINSALTIKNNFINTMMSLTEKDYTASADAYNKTFTQNMQLQNAFETKQYHEQTLTERISTDARAKLSTMNTIIASSGKSFTDFVKSNPALGAQINDLEMKAGFPPGFMAEFARTKPRANVIGTTSGVDANGNKMMSIISQDPDTGDITTTVYPTGLKDTTTTAFKTQAFNAADSILRSGGEYDGVQYNALGSDGYVDPGLYMALRNDYSTYGSVLDFDAKFKQLLNPESATKLGIGKPAASLGDLISTIRSTDSGASTTH